MDYAPHVPQLLRHRHSRRDDRQPINEAIWNGDAADARRHVIVENRHQPTTLHLKSYIDDRYKLTLYFNRDYGEVFDLRDDPGEVTNLYADAELRAELDGTIAVPPKCSRRNHSPTTACAWPTSPPACTSKVATKANLQINFDPSQARYELFDLSADPGRSQNLWDNSAFRQARADMARALLFSRWGMEPLWMPRIAGA